MKKSENLILRIDPELKKIIDNKAKVIDSTTSELVRNILSIIFFVDIEDQKIKKFLIQELSGNITTMRNILKNPFIDREPQLKTSIGKVLISCEELLENLVDNIEVEN